MKVIGVGFGRTGTSSLGSALERLGFGPCYHMFNIVREPERIQDWLDAADRGDADWDQVLAGFETVMDFPAVAFWRELVDHYPTAKVILTVREPGAWYDSAAKTIFRKAIQAENSTAARRAALGLVTRLSPDFSSFLRMIDTTVRHRLFGGSVADRGHAIDVFNRHIADVKRYVDADRLLVYDVATGWAPLCEFLGAPAPANEPFPRGNDIASFHKDEGRRMRRLMINSIIHRNRQRPAAADRQAMR